jgi:hypothetical protein
VHFRRVEASHRSCSRVASKEPKFRSIGDSFIRRNALTSHLQPYFMFSGLLNRETRLGLKLWAQLFVDLRCVNQPYDVIVCQTVKFIAQMRIKYCATEKDPPFCLVLILIPVVTLATIMKRNSRNSRSDT